MTETAELPKTAQKIDPKLANAWKTKAGKDLTEAELQAMPEAEYMNDKQLEFFRARLQALKDDLLSNAGETTEHLREDTSIVPDPADRATIEEEHALELRTRDRERKLLKKIAQALGRLDTGEYGYCDETGEPIGLARLQQPVTFFGAVSSGFLGQRLMRALRDGAFVGTGTVEKVPPFLNLLSMVSTARGSVLVPPSEIAERIFFIAESWSPSARHCAYQLSASLGFRRSITRAISLRWPPP